MCIGHFTAVSGDALNCNNPMLTADPSFNNQITYDYREGGEGDNVLSSSNGGRISLIEFFLYLSLGSVSTLTKQIIFIFQKMKFYLFLIINFSIIYYNIVM
jgi:hypothetical protein